MRDNAACWRPTPPTPPPSAGPLADPRDGHAVVGSTDMGNVSYLVPSIHPMIRVAPRGVPIHTAEFAVHARSEAGDRAVLDGAKAMAMTVVDLWCRPDAVAAAAAELAADPAVSAG